jgi:hypothetical protein
LVSLFGGDRKGIWGITYQTAADEEDGDGDVLEVLGAPFAAGVAKMLEENVGGTVEEDEGALDKLGGGAPFLACPLGADVPCLCPR